MNNQEVPNNNGNIRPRFNPRRNRIRMQNRIARQNRRNVIRVQRYRKEWEFEPNRIYWLRKVTEYRAHCEFCNTPLTAKLSVIKKHEETDGHVTNLQEFLRDPNRAADNHQERRENYESEMARIKVAFALFFSENKLPMQLIEKLVPFMIKICGHNTDSMTALRNMKMRRTTFTKLIQDLDVVYKEQLIEKLSTQKFSILFDESTDVATEKYGN